MQLQNTYAGMMSTTYTLQCNNLQNCIVYLWAVPDAAFLISLLHVGHSNFWQVQEDKANASRWRATFEKTVAAYQRNLSQHPTGLLADFYIYDEKHMVYNAADGWVHETGNDGAYWMNACRCADSSVRTTPVMLRIISDSEPVL